MDDYLSLSTEYLDDSISLSGEEWQDDTTTQNLLAYLSESDQQPSVSVESPSKNEFFPIKLEQSQNDTSLCSTSDENHGINLFCAESITEEDWNTFPDQSESLHQNYHYGVQDNEPSVVSVEVIALETILLKPEALIDSPSTQHLASTQIINLDSQRLGNQGIDQLNEHSFGIDIDHHPESLKTSIKKDCFKKIARNFMKRMPSNDNTFLITLFDSESDCMHCLNKESKKKQKSYRRRIYDVINAFVSFGIIEIVGNCCEESEQCKDFHIQEKDIIGEYDGFCFCHPRRINKRYRVTGVFKDGGEAVQRRREGVKKREDRSLRKYGCDVARYICELWPTDATKIIRIDELSNIMGINIRNNKRRIYDLTNILEGIDILSKEGKGKWTVNWMNRYFSHLKPATNHSQLLFL
ncbi:E2F family transcription factor [Endozoicomonas sp. Mp262]|uniref:E2F family transcription factor n=1 Tax=Endozoicomonas sp. Mp262 TaxID=2919499 RepID=UPI0021D829F9